MIPLIRPPNFKLKKARAMRYNTRLCNHTHEME